MIPNLRNSLLTLFAVAFIASACKSGANKNGSAPAGNKPAAQAKKAPEIDTSDYEKHTPAPGAGNVQGRVYFNDQPTENIEVKLCEKFSSIFGGCSGQTYAAKSNAKGEYVIKDVPPKEYEGLIARVFNTNSYVFLKTGVVEAAKYNVKADETLFVQPTHLFKSDVKIVNPKAGSKVATKTPELKWEAYPDAAYYKFTLYPQDSKVTAPYINERVEGASFALDKPLEKGVYRIVVEAYNKNDRKLADCPDDIKFTVTAE